PRNCGVDRNSNYGYCGVPEQLKVARASLHMWEEPCISGKNGSGTVFFSGCNLKCIYCQNYQISQENFGRVITVNRLKEIISELIQMGAHNINLVNPSHYTQPVKKALIELKEAGDLTVPVVYNSNGYETVETLKSMEGLIDVYLPDIKYFSEQTAL